MTTKINFRVIYKPQELNYDVTAEANNNKLLFHTSKSKLERFVRDLQTKKTCKLKGNNGEQLRIMEGVNHPSRKRISEYIELVLEL